MLIFIPKLSPICTASNFIPKNQKLYKRCNKLPSFDLAILKQAQKQYLSYSKETRKDEAAAQGANTIDTNRNAPINDKCASNATPAILASTAPAPKISTGI